MARYKGRKSTISSYKKALANFKKRVHRLEAKGVSVPRFDLKQSGDHVYMKDVNWLNSMSTQKIAKRSQITVLEEQTITINGSILKGAKEKVVAKGKDVVRTLKKLAVRSAREKRKTKKNKRTYTDPETGDTFDSNTGELISKGTSKPIEYGKVITVEDFADAYLNQFMENLGNYTMSNDELTSVKSSYVRRVGQNANEVRTYIEEALNKYGKEYVVQQLQGIASSGKTLNQYILYDKDAFDLYWNELIKALPLESRYDSDLDFNDDDWYDEGEDYEE